MCAATRSTSSRPGRRLLLALGLAARLARPRLVAALPPGARRLARARLRRARRALGDPAAALARRRRDAPRRRARRPPRPAAGRRVLLRPRPRPDACATRAGSASTVIALGLRRRRLRADRHLRDPALVVAQLGRARLVHASSSASPTRASRTCPRTSSTTRATSTRLPAARLGLPLAARDLVHVRDGAPALRRVVAPAPAAARRLDPDRRRCSSPASSGRTRAAPTSRSRSGSSSSRSLRPQCAASRSPAPRCSSSSSGFAFVKAYPHIGAEDELHAARAAHPAEARERQPGAGRRRRVERARGREHLEPSQEPARRDQDRPPPSAGLRPRQRRLDRRAHRTSRSRPASRPTPSSASTPGSSAGCSSSPGRSPCSSRLFRCTAWLSARDGRDARARAADRHHRRARGSSSSSGRSPAGACPTRDVPTASRHVPERASCAPAGTCLPWMGCGSRSSISRSAPRSLGSPRARAAARGGGGSERAGGAREPDAHAGLAQPRRHPGDDRLDDLRPRLDGDRAPAVELHLAAQAPSRCPSTARRGPPSGYQEDHLISLELGGNPTDPREPLARAVPARGRRRQDRERAQRQGLLRRAHARRGPARRVGAQARARVSSAFLGR